VNEILDLSRIEAGRLELEKVPWNPRDDRWWMDGDAFRAEEKGLDLWSRMEQWPCRKCMYSEIPTRLQQVLMNLVGNAIKFTETRFRVYAGGGGTSVGDDAAA
jgi:signal transduction histidine kinase